MIVSGVMDKPTNVAAPPEDLVNGASGNDIIDGFVRPNTVTVDDIRADSQVASLLVA